MKAVDKSIQKVVTVLGAGFISGAVVEYLSRDDRLHINVVSMFPHEVDKLKVKYPNIKPFVLNVTEQTEEIGKLVQGSDLVVSILPTSYHLKIADICIKHHKDLITPSYISSEMKNKDQLAREAGITILNEVGLDPGIDHMLAMQCFDDVRSKGGTVISCESYCGGLPAPECADNVLGYKFSWSPVGVLQTFSRGATFKKDGNISEIPDGKLLDACDKFTYLPDFNLEWFPNRDSLMYGPKYGIESVTTLIRGTLRYQGFCMSSKALLELGLTSPEHHPLLQRESPDITWKELVASLIGKPPDISPEALKDALSERFSGDIHKVSVLESLGILDDKTVVEKLGSPLLSASKFLGTRLIYGPGQRDLVIMHIKVGIQWSDGSVQQRHLSLVVYGDPDGHSAMSKTTGYPVAMAAKMMLSGKIQGRGVLDPCDSDIYRPILDNLRKEGIVATERVEN